MEINEVGLLSLVLDIVIKMLCTAARISGLCHIMNALTDLENVKFITWRDYIPRIDPPAVYWMFHTLLLKDIVVCMLT